MSLNIVPLRLSQSIDPVVNINNVRDFCVDKSGSDVFYKIFPSSGQATITQNSYIINPNSRETIVDRKLYMQSSFTITLTSVITAGTVIPTGGAFVYNANGQSGALRAYPLTMCIKTIALDLGDTTFSTNVNEYWSAMERYSSEYLLEDRDYSTFPSMPDTWQTYAQGTNQNNNPLATYGVNSTQCPRGGFYNLSVVSNGFIPAGVSAGATYTAVLNVQITEPLFLSPLFFGHGDRSGFCGIDQMTLNIVYGDLTRIWSQVSPQPGAGGTPPTPYYVPPTTVSVSVLTGNLPNATHTGSNIIMKQITPRIVTPIPRSICYPLNVVTSYNNGTAFTLSGWAGGNTLMSSTFVTLGNITLNTVPNRLYIYARQQNADLTPLSSDVFAVLNNLTINWNGRILLSSASQQDLYQISVRNGCNLSWPQWSNYVGSVLAVDFAKDIGLSSYQAPSLLDRSTLSITCNFSNSNPNAINYNLYVNVIEEGTCTIVDGHVSRQIGVITQQDVLNSDSTIVVPSLRHSNIFGAGNFWDDFKSGISKGFNFAKDNILPVVQTGLQLAKLGLGVTGGRHGRGNPYTGSGVTGGVRHRKRGHSRGRGLDEEEMKQIEFDNNDQDEQNDSDNFNGGQLMSRSELKKRYRNID